MSDQERRVDELNALESIFCGDEFQYYTCCFDEDEYDDIDDTIYGGQIYISVLIDNGFTVIFKNNFGDESKDIKMCLNYLPPIELNFELPIDYPSTSPPNFAIFVPWLTNDKIMKLSQKLMNIWNQHKGSEILYIWALFLKQETLSFLNSTEVLIISPDMFKHYLITLGKRKQYRLRAFNVPYHKLWRALFDYDKNTREKMFLKTLFICKNCSKVSSGKFCIFFKPCEHVFCKNCIATYMKKLTDENKICSLILCPRIGCHSTISLFKIMDLVADGVHRSVDETKD